MQSDFDRAKIMFECDFRACMNACTCGLCSSTPCDQRSSLVRDFFLFVCIMSIVLLHVASLDHVRSINVNLMGVTSSVRP